MREQALTRAKRSLKEQNKMIDYIEKDGTFGERVWLPILRMVRWWTERSIERGS